MQQLVIHAQTEQQIASYLNNPAHALLLVGPMGSGREALVRHILSQLLQIDDLDPINYPYFKAVQPEKDKISIGIEAIRELQPFVKLKLPISDRTRWRIISIHNAPSLTTEAQNALLKLLEEPPERTLFILTTGSLERVLPTIRSRTQQLRVLLPTQAALKEHFNTNHTEAAIQQAYMMSGGLPGLMSALLTEEDSHPLKSAVSTAKELLKATQFERLAKVDELAKKKTETLHVLFVLQQMAQASIAQAANVNNQASTQRIKQWHRIQKAAYEAEQAYDVSAQAKLTLTNLMLSL
jgi:DNA polymerase-3 subunit delta'